MVGQILASVQRKKKKNQGQRKKNKKKTDYKQTDKWPELSSSVRYLTGVIKNSATNKHMIVRKQKNYFWVNILFSYKEISTNFSHNIRLNCKYMGGYVRAGLKLSRPLGYNSYCKDLSNILKRKRNKNNIRFIFKPA